nr:DUF3034 family protein [uncultured Caldimonas sp.]
MPCSPPFRTAFAASLVAALAAFAPAVQAGNGKLLLTGGVSSLDGAAGGGLTPWALTGTYATAGQWGASAHVSRATTQKYGLSSHGVAFAWDDRLELSYARQDFDADVVVPDTTLKLDIFGAKLRVAGDAVLDSDRWMPQVSLGVLHKRLKPGSVIGGVLDAVGADRSGTDVYVSATKLFLAQGVLVNGTLRATRANQNGLLGFGSDEHGGYQVKPEVSVAWLLSRTVAIGAEYRAKPDNLAFAGAAFREDAWKDLFVAWAPSKHLSVTLAYVELGNIVGHKRQSGAYGSVQVAF